MTALHADIDKFCDDMRVEFITGSKSMDEWDAYTEQLNKFKISELLGIYQAALGRYRAMPGRL